jgi:hypothetical protein
MKEDSFFGGTGFCTSHSLVMGASGISKWDGRKHVPPIARFYLLSQRQPPFSLPLDQLWALSLPNGGLPWLAVASRRRRLLDLVQPKS